MTAPAARLSIGGLPAVGLYRTPWTEDAVPGQVTVFLGNTPSGLPVTLTVTSLQWLDDLEAAARAARAQGIIEAGMVLA